MFVLFVAVAAVILGAANMGFEQGKANPQAKNFFESSSRHFSE
jgi:hypothetical protein